MNLKQLYDKVPVAKHLNIKKVGKQVLYDDGTKIYSAVIGEDGELVPMNIETRNALKALSS